MIFVTGDCHADFTKFNTKSFPEQKELTKEDIVIICGDFGGIWDNSKREKYWLAWLSDKPFTTCFVDGNHENFDRLNGAEFPIIDYHGGKAHKITDSIYHLMRGYVFEFENRKFFCFGGAKSHDIKDGILDLEKFKSGDEAAFTYRQWIKQGKEFRINHLSWWKEELPSKKEMNLGKKNLAKNNNKVDFVITHCLPQSIASMEGFFGGDIITNYFDELIINGLVFDKWYCGHYHREQTIYGKYNILYHSIERII